MGTEVYIAGGVAIVIGLVIGFFIDRIRLGAGYRTSDQLIQDAKREAEAIRKNGELEAKEEVLKRREQLERL